MEAYNEYIKLVSGLLNVNNLIIISLMIMALMAVVSVIKFRVNIAITKKAVKDAIRELEAEKEKKLKELETERKKKIIEIAEATKKEEDKKLSEESAKILN